MRPKLPKKYRGDGRHLFCYKCKRPVTSDWDKNEIGQYKKPIDKRCNHENGVVYFSKPYSKVHGRAVITKAWPEITDPESFFEKHITWHKMQKENNYGLIERKEVVKPFLLLDCVNYYLDYLNNVPSIVPVQKAKQRTRKHIVTVQKHLQTFCDVLRKNGINPSSVHVNIPEEFVGYYFLYLEEQKYANKTFNHYISTLRVFYNVMISEGITSSNPFVGVTRKYTFNDPKIILMDELVELLNVIKVENGIGYKSGHRRNFFRPWLKNAIMLALYTGERRDGVFQLKWGHIEGDYIKVPNFKVNDLMQVEKYHWVLITNDFANFLATIGYGDPDDYIIDTEEMSIESAKELCTAAFTHFWSISSNVEKKEFKCLRKTQKTRELNLMGDKRKYLQSGTVEVEREHYIGQKEIQKEFKGKDMFPEIDLNAVLN